ncbi:UNKNOWN [Stylonychia lemnae]|uniref:Serine aminopeptidase S33 domain-containing protein n=1 Tax=Stylonychia lemnae TaxID=5949 RepID=A0A077ZU02_STYLE|nr:UNKNOWN [Stylonychia lemnae]|eukprot:CDW71931.1 UNKNOWN [Stylonychia lemnae]
MKDKDLDKSRYQPSDADYIKQYVQNYMKEDPRGLSEEEKQKLTNKAEKLAQLDLEQNKKQQQEYQQTLKLKQDQQQVKTEDTSFIQPDQIKKIFDKITEIDSDPNGKSAQDFYKKIEELEKSNQNKKKSQIIIKTLKKGKNVQNLKYDMTGGMGRQISQEQMMFERKHIDFKRFQFPEICPIDYRVKHKNEEIKIYNVRYPAVNQAERKGIIHFLHGYGEHAGRYAYFAQYFAKAGYDFFAIDQRGFGRSEGKRARIESEESLLSDYQGFMEKVDQSYGEKNLSRYMVGYSMGSNIACKLTLAQPKNYFQAMGLLAPYFQLLNQEMIDKYIGLAKLLNYVAPNYQLASFPVKSDGRFTRHYQNFLDDEFNLAGKISVNNIIVGEQMKKKFLEHEKDKIITPLIMILGGNENVVCNKTAKQAFDLFPIEDKAIITYDELDHFIIQDAEYLNLIVNDLISFFNTH